MSITTEKINQSSVEIRQGTSEDLPKAIELDEKTFSEHGTAELPEVIRARHSVFPEGFLVAALHSQVIGFATCEKWREYREPELNQDPNDTHSPDGTIICVTDLVVDSPYQGRGFGSMLLKALIKLAARHACKEIVLQTTHAQRFYMKEGFSLQGKRLQYGIELSILSLRLGS